MDTNQQSLSAALLQSIELMAHNEANEVTATLTVECKVIEVIDAGQGTYKVQYLGNTFEATAVHTEIIYEPDEMVYVIIPNGNMDATKFILAPVSPVTATYASTQEGTSYITLGDNLFASVADVELCTYRPHDADPTGSDTSPYVNIDTTGFAQLFTAALKDSRVFNFTCRIKTNIDKSRRSKGNYGLILDIPVIQEDTSKTYSIVIDINNLRGDPYNFTQFALQNCYFELPEGMEYDTSRPPYIRSFVVGFLGDYNSTAPTDIWIKDISLLPALAVDSDTMSGYYLALTASEGSSFLASRTDDTKQITPTIYLNGKVTRLTNFDCYWFKENYLIDTEHDKFNRFGGLGWEILNTKTNTVIEEDGKETFQYVTNVYSQSVTQVSVHTATRYKCVLVKGDDVVSQTITIRNLASSAEISLSSATGLTSYTENVGKVRLILRYYEAGVTNQTAPSSSVSYAWQRFDKLGSYIDNDFYTIDRLNEKVTINGKVYFETEISYDTSEVDELNSIYCTVYTETASGSSVSQAIIGTASITITTGAAATYNIKVENGDKLYKYDVDGDSPKVADYDGPLTSALKTINPITITLFKPDGTEFTSDEYAVTKVEWLIPTNSLITLTTAQKTDSTTNPGYWTIGGTYNTYKSLSYDIANSFNKKKNDNTILIRAYFRDNVAENVANLRFLKDGEAGTNGSKYAAVITYNGVGYGERTSAGLQNKLQLIYDAQAGIWYRWNPAGGSDPVQISYNATIGKFGLDLYADGEKITTQSVSWSIFDLDYTYDYIRCPFTITTSGSIVLKANTASYSKWTSTSDRFCATIQACCRAKKSDNDDGQTDSEEYVYAYYPIEMTRIAKTAYLKGLVPTFDGGYSEVVYASDGTNPQYDNSENFSVTDSLYNDDAGDLYDYTWTGSSNITVAKNASDKSCKATPVTKFDNGVAKNYVMASLTTSSTQRAKLQTLIAETRAEQTNQQNRLAYYNALQSAIGVVNEFKYDSYVSQLETARQLFNTKSNLTRTTQELIDRLNNLQSLAQSYYNQSGDSRLRIAVNEATSRLLTFNNLLNYIYQLGINSSAVNNIKARTPQNLLMTVYTLKETDKSYFRTLYDAIVKYNNQINSVYTTYYNNLNSSFVNLQTIVQTVMSQLNSYIGDNRWTDLASAHNGIIEQQYLYSGLVKNLQAYVKAISGSETYSYDKVINNVLKPMKIALANFQNISYNNTISTITATVQSLAKSYTEYYNMTLPENSTAIIHIKPIIMIFNRYEMSNINGWDGNKTEVSDGYILSPQVGAGKKENGMFTGIVMGIKQIGAKSITNQRIGLFGFHQGIQSLFLNAKDGSAILGKSGSGQIIIDPSQSKGLLYSSNYWINYNASDGKPKNYNDSNLNKQGMLIDLTTPEIRFGNGNFVVNSSGHITAAGGGSIAGWEIDDTTIHSRISVGNGRLVLDSGAVVSGTNSKGEKQYTASTPGKVYTGNHSTLASTTKGFYLSQDGLSISDAGSANRIELNTTGNPKIYSGGHSTLASTTKGFYLSQDGLSVCNGTSSRIQLSTEGTPIIYSNSHSALDNTNAGFYLGNDGLSIGNTIRITAADGGQVLVGRVTGSRVWKINGDSSNSYIGNNADSFDCSNLDDADDYSIGGNSSSVYLGTDGIRLGKKFAVDRSGNLVTKHLIANSGGTIGGWTITSNQLYSNNLHLHSSGRIYTENYEAGESGWSISSNGNAYFNALYASKSGTIGGWTISSTSLSAGNIRLNADGSMSGGSTGTWSIAQNGNAIFNNLTANSIFTITGSNGSFSDTGFNFGMGSYGSIANGGFNLAGGGTTYGISGLGIAEGTTNMGGKNIVTRVKELAVDSLNVNSELTFQGIKVKWQSIRCIVKRKMTWTNVTATYVTGVSGGKDSEVSVTKDASRKYCVDLESTSWYRDFYILTNKGDRNEGGGED